MDAEPINACLLLPLSDDESYQTFGDFKFYPNGGASLGPTHFVRGAPIHCYRFGANLVALRHIDQPNLLEIDLPFGGRLKFLYRPWFRKWYQLVKVEDPALYFHQERYGTMAALALYYVRRGMRWAIVEAVQLLLLALAVAGLILLVHLTT